MEEALRNPDTLVLILVFSVPLVAIIGHFWSDVLKCRANNDLKQSMLDHGMSAEEIAQVMNAGNTTAKHARHRDRPRV